MVHIPIFKNLVPEPRSVIERQVIQRCITRLEGELAYIDRCYRSNEGYKMGEGVRRSIKVLSEMLEGR
jgi:hypothetical protein